MVTTETTTHRHRAPAGIDGLSPSTPLITATGIVAGEHLGHVLHYLPLAANPGADDPEPVHKLRVATRRLAAALDALSEGVPIAIRREIGGVLGKIRRTCGEARALDVERTSLERLLDSARSTDLAVVDLLCERVALRRERLQPVLCRKLDRQLPRMKFAGEQLISAVAALGDRDCSGFGTFGQAASRILQRELLLISSRNDVATASEGALHRLRLDCKHLRYSSEVFVPILGESFPTGLYPEVVRIQDLLGKFHDATEVIERYRALRDKWRRARRRSQWRRKPQAQFTWKELRSGLKFVQRSFGVQAEKSRAEFERLWPEFIGAGFCKPFERLLRELQSRCVGPCTDANSEGGPRVVPTEN